MSSAAPIDLDRPWPPEALEHLGRCPVCDSAARTLRFEGLTDKAFRSAEGAWSMYDCGGCGAAYLDPRPDEASIGRAYSRYYTHASETAGDVYPWRRTGLKDRLKAAYLNHRYGYKLPQAIGIGGLLIRAFPEARHYAEFAIRHLPAPRGPDDRLLDVGCGNGDFLLAAKDLGYRVLGLDPDPAAVAFGRERGVEIRQTLLPDPDFTESGFAHVMLSHVLEHLHRPREALAQALTLLRPGGRLWLSQPNLEAAGLKRFGPDWRGLETPRHLTLFSFETLAALLRDVGFAKVTHLQESYWQADFYFCQSQAMANGLDPYENRSPPGWTEGVEAEAAAAKRASRRDTSLCETLTVSAVRPLG